MKDTIPSEVKMNAIEIKGKAILCFDESGMRFQGVIHAKDNAQYAMYGTKSTDITKCSQERINKEDPESSCGCSEPGSATADPSLTYDIRIVDCEVGEEYNLSQVHARGGEDVSLNCKDVKFTTAQTYKGDRADMEAQKAIGQRMKCRRGTVFEGPIEIVAPQPLQENRPWVL